MQTVVAQSESIAAEYLGPLRDSSAVAAAPDVLQQRLQEDGYIYLRSFFDHADVMAARRDIFTRLAAVGEISEPVIDGIFSGTSKRDEKEPDRGAFWRSVFYKNNRASTNRMGCSRRCAVSHGPVVCGGKLAQF